MGSRQLCTVDSNHVCVHLFGSVKENILNIQKFHVLPTLCIYVFCVDLRTNSDYFPTQH